MSVLPARLSVIVAFCSAAASGAMIQKTVLFPTADTLRVQVTLESAEATAGVELRGRLQLPAAERPLWEGALGTVDLPAGRPVRFEHTVTGLTPEPWSPGSPVLYEFDLQAGRRDTTLDRTTLRTGFRSVESRDGHILLNGKPVFLCGLAINPPGRGVPEATAFTREYAYDYVRFMRSRHFNCIRLNLEFQADPRAQVWFDACDELGMLVYQGCYGSPPTGKTGQGPDKNRVPADVAASVAAYQEVFETYARHPSIVLYILSNELPYSGTRGKAWHEFLTAAHAELRKWDPSRLYIGNAGYGEGKEGDINDVHRYWGWYYNSFLTYYNLRRAHEIYGDEGAVQPFTFSECVGSFTSTLGEFNLTFRKQLGAQLHWTGHSSEQAADALAYQAFMAQRACESFRTMREINPRLAGLMPFTILYFNWNGIRSFDRMKAKPVADAMARAYQPILLAWENWRPQVYAGTTLSPWVHIVNDAEDFSALPESKIEYELLDSNGKRVVSGVQPTKPVPYFGHAKQRVAIAIPAEAVSGDYRLVGRLNRGGRIVSENECGLFIAGQDWRSACVATPASRSADYVLYDPGGRTAKALARLGVELRRVSKLDGLAPRSLLVVGEDAAGDADLSAFVRGGGRILLLGQKADKFKPDRLPVRIAMLSGTANHHEYLGRKRPTADQMYVNVERPDHPVFAGLDRSRFRLWSDYTDWDQSKPGFPSVYPVTRGFKLTDAEGLARTAILANYDRGLEGVALCEMFDGKGSILFTSFDLVSRVGSDPVADRLVMNLLTHLAADEHPLHPLVTEPIEWGRYATEKGLVTGPLNGLVVNCRWVAPPTDPDGKPMPDNEGAWNTLPGDQYVAIGRRPYGPYSYNNGTATQRPDRDAPTGAGVFHARLPKGRTRMLTRVENPSRKAGTIEIEVNGDKQTFAVPAGETVTARSPIPAGDAKNGVVTVRYSGHTFLVLRTTEFE